MNVNEKLERYLEGWRLGDGEHSLAALTPDFVYDDPNTGLIHRENFVQFVEDFKSAAAELNDGTVPSPFLTYSDIVTSDLSHPHTAWCWWQVTGTKMQGSALIKYDDAGVISERIAYHSRLPG